MIEILQEIQFQSPWGEGGKGLQKADQTKIYLFVMTLTHFSPFLDKLHEYKKPTPSEFDMAAWPALSAQLANP